jgi:phosphoglucosamine mutase
LLVLDKHTTGDGLISALQVLQGCVRAGQSMAEQLSNVVLFPQVLLNVRLEKGHDWRQNARLQAEMGRVEQELAGQGRILVRPSGTEPVLRLMVEAHEAVIAQTMAERLAQTLS